MTSIPRTLVPPGSAAAPRAHPERDLPWRIRGLLSLYRLLVPVALLAALGIAAAAGVAPPRRGLLAAASLAWLALGAAGFVAQQRQWCASRPLALASGTVDSAALALIVHAMGGIGSGLEALLTAPVLGTAALTGARQGAALTALAAALLTAQQLLVSQAPAAGPAVLTALLLGTALAAGVLANRLRPGGAPPRAAVDPGNHAQLSEYIVRHLRESILVIDSQDRIRLINESAAQLLGAQSARQEAHLSEVSPRLLQLLSAWRASLAAGKGIEQAAPTFTAADGSRIIGAHFVALPATAPAPVIVFLEEPDLLELRAQQSRLAALARLSASIAHEVKNPVHAMSQAGQLLAESPDLADEDRRLTQIIRTNGQRVSRIIDSVLQLSRGERTRETRLSLRSWTDEFRQEFCDTMQWPLVRLAVRGPKHAPEVRADPGQLRQIVWNLCENALRHAAASDREQPVELVYGRITPNARPFLEVSDRGPGVAPEHVERIFEPFFSRGAGTGMGLYLARELAQTNGATLLYLARPGGGSTFRIIFTDPRRWEARSA